MKKLCTISLLFVVVFVYIVLVPDYAFATQTNEVVMDGNYFAMERQKSLDNALITMLYNNRTQDTNGFLPQLTYGRSYYLIADDTTSQPGQSIQNYVYIYVYDYNTEILGFTNANLYDGNGELLTVPCYTIQPIGVYRLNVTNAPVGYTVGLYDPNPTTKTIPAVCYNYFSDAMTELLINKGFLNAGTTTSDVVTGLNNINQAVVNEGNQTQQAIGDMSNATTNSINSMSNSVTNSIAQSQAQSQANYDTFTNTTYYDNTVTTINPNDFMGNVSDSNDTQQFLQTLYNKVYGKFTNPSRSTRITIPLPHNMGDIVLDSSDMVNFWESNQLLETLVTTFWYFIIGRWVFSFCRRIYLWLATGSFVNTMSLSEYLSEQNEIIKTYLM